MDIKKELQQVQINDNDSVHSMVAAIKKEQGDLERKLYIFQAIEIVNALDEMVKNNLKELYKQNIYGIKLYHGFDADLDVEEFYCYPVDKDNKTMGNNNIVRTENNQSYISHPQYLDFEELFSKYHGFGLAPNTCQYGASGYKVFMFSEGINKDEMLSFLLDSELKSVFDYSQLQLSMNSDNKIQSKPSKI